MPRLLPILLFAAATASAAAACTGEITGGPFTDPLPDPAAPPDPYEELERLQREGPPRYASRVHGCTKLRYRTLGNVLRSRGVALAATGEVSAGRIYREGSAALGAPSYAGRTRETLELGLATTSKLYDIFAQAAPELIASMSARPECAGAPLFDAANRCNPDGVSCLIGVPATPTHLQICDQTVARAADVASGKQLAVAVLAAAAHTCE